MTINLAYQDKSDIPYEISKYPDGQQNVVLKYSNESDKAVTIKSRFNSFEDLELILCVTKDLKRLGVSKIRLDIPYLLGARSDRKFQAGGNSYLVDIVAPIINAQNYSSVHTLDAHSDVAEACIQNLQVESNLNLVGFALNDLNRMVFRVYPPEDLSKKLVFVAPDAGAVKKIYTVTASIGNQERVLICSKYRDESGALSRVDVPMTDDQVDKNFIIVDDICDGGRTFLNIAKVIKDRAGFTGKIYLIVTHGIFSHGLQELNNYFDRIYCTNSYSDVKDKPFADLVQQLNVF